MTELESTESDKQNGSGADATVYARHDCTTSRPADMQDALDRKSAGTQDALDRKSADTQDALDRKSAGTPDASVRKPAGISIAETSAGMEKARAMSKFADTVPAAEAVTDRRPQNCTDPPYRQYKAVDHTARKLTEHTSFLPYTNSWAHTVLRSYRRHAVRMVRMDCTDSDTH